MILKFSFFSPNWLGLPNDVPFWVFLGEFDPLNVVGNRTDLKNSHPCVIPRNLSHCAAKQK